MMKWYGSSNNLTKIGEIPVTNLRSIALLAILVALSVTGRILFSFIPNVQPSTTLIIITTLIFGVKFGLIHAGLSTFLSNLILGMGPWTLAQIVSYSVVVLLIGVIRLFKHKLSHFMMALASGICGLIYGFFISLVQAPIFGFKYLWAYYLSGIPFDLAHAAGNIAFYIAIAPMLIPLLEKQVVKFFMKQSPTPPCEK